MIVPAALAYQLATCAPTMNVADAAAIAQHESTLNSNALMDNDTRRSYTNLSYQDALRIGTTLVRMGHWVDVGLLQVDSNNFVNMGYSVADMLNPCTNARVAGNMLKDAYEKAINVYHYAPGDPALWAAFEKYHCGAPDYPGHPACGGSEGASYANAVMSNARNMTIVFPAPDAVVQQGRYFGGNPTVPLQTQDGTVAAAPVAVQPQTLTPTQYVEWRYQQELALARARAQAAANAAAQAAYAAQQRSYAAAYASQATHHVEASKLDAYRRQIQNLASHVPDALAPLVNNGKGNNQ